VNLYIEIWVELLNNHLSPMNETLLTPMNLLNKIGERQL
jgi:hypothetical protein